MFEPKNIRTVGDILRRVAERKANRETAPVRIPNCPRCNDNKTYHTDPAGNPVDPVTYKGYAIVHTCSCDLRMWYRRECEIAGVPERYRAATITHDGPGFSPFRTGEDQRRDALGLARAVLAKLEAWVTERKEVQQRAKARKPGLQSILDTAPETIGVPGLTLAGVPGTGKTHLATAVMCDLIRLKVKGYRFFSSLRFAHVCVIAIMDRIREARENKEPSPLGPARIADICLIDDMTPPRNGTPGAKAYYMSLLTELVNERYENGLPTLITTNIKESQMDQEFGPAIASRLAEMTVIIPLDGEDERKKTMRENVRELEREGGAA